jgi:hypothetical protein
VPISHLIEGLEGEQTDRVLAGPILFHIPVCPFSQRVEILLTLKGYRDQVRFEVVDITKPRDPELLAKLRGSTSLPALETEGGDIIRESLPDEPRFTRVRRWRDLCLAHPAAQQVTNEEIVKVYYDYARGAGNGALLPGRRRSSFAFEPSWSNRPWPPKDKYAPAATDAELGL